MRCSLSSTEFTMLSKYIEEYCGIEIREEKAYLIENRLSSLLDEFQLRNYGELYTLISNEKNAHITRKMINAITTNETFWFREQSPWVVLEKKLLPMYIDELRSRKRTKVRIWSAACSTGQEPYSTAMCIDSYLTKNKIYDIDISQFEILATDISYDALQIAEAGVYDNVSILRGLNEAYRQRYFSKRGDKWLLDSRIIHMVAFRQFNLLNSVLALGKFDVIFCRYVLIYFSESVRRDIINKMYTALKSNGIMFIGNSELLKDDNHLFLEEKENKHVYYIKRRNEK